ncbi:hypothetical protein ILUMI_13580, partial [Ignelater luminosus]
SSTGNSYVERVHSTLIEHFRIPKEQDKTARMIVKYPLIVLTYNDTIHSSTNFKPRDLVFGHIQSNFELFGRTPLVELKTSYIENQKQIMSKLYTDIKTKEIQRKSQVIEKLKSKIKYPQTTTVQTTKGYEHLKPRTKIKQKFKPVNLVSDQGQIVLADTGKKIHKSNLKIRKYQENQNEDP